MAAKGTICAVIIGILGLALLLTGIFLGLSINTMIQTEVEKAFVVKNDPNSDSFKAWADPTRDNDTIVTQDIYLYGISNLDEYLGGGAPKFVEHGPYPYRYIVKKYNISFTADDEQVTYASQTIYERLSGFNESTVTMLSIPYTAMALSALSQAGTTPPLQTLQGLHFTIFSGVIQNVFDGFALHACPTCDTATRNLMAAAQWTNLTYTNGVSVRSVPQSSAEGQFVMQLFNGAGVVPELNYTSLSASVARDLLYGGNRNLCGFFRQVTCIAGFLQYASVGNISAINATYGIDDAALIGRIANYWSDGTDKIIASLGAFAGSSSNASYGARRFTIATRPASYWIESSVDPFGTLSGIKELANPAYFKSDWTPDVREGRCANCRDTYLTGKSNPDDARVLLKYRGMEVLAKKGTPGANSTYWCAIDVPVRSYSVEKYPSGKATGFGWKDTVTKDSKLPVFTDSIYRVAEFVYMNDSKVFDVPTLRFRVRLDKNDSFAMLADGVSNLLCPSGLPIVVSPPHFSNVTLPPGLVPEVTYTASDPSGMAFTTFIDVEPTTGATLRGYRQLQANFLLPAALSPDNKDRLIPLYWARQKSEMRQQDAAQFKTDLLDKLSLPATLMGALVGVGAFLIVVAVAFVVRGYVSKPAA